MVNRFIIIIHLNRPTQKVLIVFMMTFVQPFHIQHRPKMQNKIQRKNLNGYKHIDAKINRLLIVILLMVRLH